MLEGCRVLDLCDERGLLTGRMLADLGADVVLVEPAVGTSARSVAPATRSGESSWFFAAYAANRRGIVCDRASSAGEGKFQQLVAEADIVLVSPTVKDGFSPEAEYERLREINPRLIYVCITAFGTRGPKASYESSDLTLFWAAWVCFSGRIRARLPRGTRPSGRRQLRSSRQEPVP